MRVILTTVKSASVSVDEQIINKIKRGFLLLIGVEKEDTEKDVICITEKIKKVRAFPDENDKINLNLNEVGGSILAISQFTLAGDVRKGSRPSFTGALNYGDAEILYNFFVKRLKDAGYETLKGKYGAHMEVASVNDGPFTLVLQSQHGILK